MGASIVMSAFFPTLSDNTSLSKPVTMTYCPNETVKALNFSPKSSTTRLLFKTIYAKSANKAIIPNVNSYVVTTEPPHIFSPTPSNKMYNEQPQLDFTLTDWKSKQTRPDMHADAFGFGRVQDGLFNEKFLIRSYDIEADQTASIETLMNHLQETALNHYGRVFGFMSNGFGATPEMSKRNLIWVYSKMKLLIDRYPSWGDIVEVNTWVASQGKNGIRREWHVRDYYSGQTILRATSLMVMMNKLTRKLVKIPHEARKEIEPCFVERMPVIDEDNHDLSKPVELDENNAEKYFIRGLTPKRGDLDPNQHVNHVKYIGWILESTPLDKLEKHELVGMTLEYRRECGRDSVVQSLTTVYSDCANSTRPNSTSTIHCDHHLSLESGITIVKAYTTWRPKRAPIQGMEAAF